MNLREKLGGEDPKGFSIGYASASSSIFDNATNMSCSNKPTYLSR